MKNKCHHKKRQGVDSSDALEISLITLNDLSPGDVGFVHEITTEDTTRQRLMDLGIIHGARIEMVRSAPLGDPVEVKVLGTSLAIRRAVARTIVVSLHGEILHGRKAHRHRFGRKS